MTASAGLSHRRAVRRLNRGRLRSTNKRPGGVHPAFLFRGGRCRRIRSSFPIPPQHGQEAGHRIARLVMFVNDLFQLGHGKSRLRGQALHISALCVKQPLWASLALAATA